MSAEDVAAGKPFLRARTLSTLYWPLRSAWMTQVDVVNRSEKGTFALLLELSRAKGYDAVVLDGATGGRTRIADLGAAAALARRRRGPAIVVTDATWSRGRTPLLKMARRAGLGAIDSPRTTYCVLSSEERWLFPRTWGVPPERVEHTPFYFTASEADLAAQVGSGGFVFSGGDSLRDYGPLLAAAREIGVPVRIAASTLPASFSRDLPANVTAGRVTHPEYMRLLRGADVVVVALAPGQERSAGQQNYLNAMAMGKVVVVPDVIGVRDHIEPGKTGLIVPPGDAAALRDAILFALKRPDEAAAIGARAREAALTRFSPERYVDAVLRVIDRAVDRARTLNG